MMMELLHVDDIRPIRDESRRTVKESFTSICRDFDEMVAKFVFYTPVVHHLIVDTTRTAIPTDIVSHMLAQRLQDHPLVITDLPRTVFRFDERLVIGTEVRSFCRKLYAVPVEIWDQTMAQLRMLTVSDHRTSRFCILTPHRREIRNPIGSHEELKLPVYYFTCYGNRETWYFTDDTLVPDSTNTPEKPPLLCYHPPIREFVELANRVLRMLQPTPRTPQEEAAQNAVTEMERTPSIVGKLAIRAESRLPDNVPLNHPPIDDRILREYHDLIRFYESVFGTA
jgi:hypothetical protein